MRGRNLSLAAAVILCAIMPSAQIRAHGTAIRVDLSADRLVVSGGVADGDGFADLVFVERDSDGDPLFPGPIVLPQFGECTLWEVPGFELRGLADGSGLFLEAISRPAHDTGPDERRLVWYWNPLTDIVEPAPSTARLHLLARDSRSMSLTPSGTAPPALEIADPVAGDLGFHNHSMLKFALADDPPAPAGAYGFYARLTSSVYEPSDPFLVVINHGAEYAQMESAALAINMAALLAGDYNRDDSIDAADYVIWRMGLGSTYSPEDYDVWQEHFGQSATGSGSGANALVAVPEPASLALVFVGLIALVVICRADHAKPEHSTGNVFVMRPECDPHR